MAKPTFIAYLPQEVEQNGEKKTFWHRVGAVFPHKTGDGFNLVIPPGLSISGKVVLLEPKDDGKGEEPPINF